MSVCFPRILKRVKATKQANNASSVPTPYSGATKGEDKGSEDGEGESEGEGEEEGELLLRTAIGVPVRAIAAKVPTTVWGDWNSVSTETHLPWAVL